MVSTRTTVNIDGSDTMRVFPPAGNRPIEEIEAGLLTPADGALPRAIGYLSSSSPCCSRR